MTISNISLLSARSLLSQAVYAKATSQDELDEALRSDAYLTASQRADFNTRYEFVHSQPNESNGFSATLYWDKITNQHVLATRGTELTSVRGFVTDLLGADIAGIGVFGYANLQAASMYRYWRKLNTVDGGDVNYGDTELAQLFTVQNGITSPALFVSPAYQVFKAEVRQDKGFGKVGAAEKVDVVGHSLGGHLAILFARFFPQNTNEVVTLNAPGFLPTSGVLTLAGFPAPSGVNITRLEGEGDGVSEIGIRGLDVGTKVRLPQENRSGPFAALSENQYQGSESNCFARCQHE